MTHAVHFTVCECEHRQHFESATAHKYGAKMPDVKPRKVYGITLPVCAECRQSDIEAV